MKDFDYSNSIQALFNRFPELETSEYILEGWYIDIPYSLYSGFGNLLIEKIKNNDFEVADRMIGFISEIGETQKENGHDLFLDLCETIQEDTEAEKYFLSKLKQPALDYWMTAKNWEKLSPEEQAAHRKLFS